MDYLEMVLNSFKMTFGRFASFWYKCRDYLHCNICCKLHYYINFKNSSTGKFTSAKTLKIREFQNFTSENDIEEIGNDNNPCVMRESWSRWWWRPRDLEWRWPSDWMPVSFRMPRKLLPNIDWKFRVPDLNVVCNDRCETAALDCIIGCENDVNCISGCLRDQTECSNGKSKLKREHRTAPAASGCVTHRVYRLYSTASVFYGVFNFRWLLITLYIIGCPCGIGCSDGCDDCSNPVCECEVSFNMNHTGWSVDHWQIVIIITWF